MLPKSGIFFQNHICISKAWQKCWNFGVNCSWNWIYKVQTSALICSSNNTNKRWKFPALKQKFPALKHLLCLAPLHINGHHILGPSNQLMFFIVKSTHCGPVTPYGIINLGQYWISESMLTITRGVLFHDKGLRYLFLIEVWKLQI